MLWIIRTDIEQSKIEKIINELYKCQNNKYNQIEFMPLIEECERIIEYNRQSQIWMVYYQYLNDRKKIPCASMREIFDQFKQSKSDLEVKLLLMKYNFDDKDEIDFDTFKLIIKEEVFP